jgi:hypothetical protein
MHQVKLDELEINAIGAALDERNLRLSYQLGVMNLQPQTPTRDFAMECVRDAIRDVLRARHAILAAVEEPEHAEDATFAQMFEGMGDYTEAELREAYGR